MFVIFVLGFELGLLLCLCVEPDIEERWQQYWRDNGDQLVLDHWHNGYVNNEEGQHSVVELPDAQSTCKPTVYTDLLENDSKVSESSACEVETEFCENDGRVSKCSESEAEVCTVSFLNGGICCVDDTNLESEYCPTVDCEDQIEEIKELLVHSSDNTAYSRTNETGHILAAGDLKNSAADTRPITENQEEKEGKELSVDRLSRNSVNDAGSNESHGSVDGVVNDSGLAGDWQVSTDIVEMNGDGFNEPQSSWDKLWEQHYANTYWYYYEWFMQWVNENDQDHDVQQLSSCQDEVSFPSQSTCVEASRESLDVVECLLNDLLLSVVDSVDHPSCPADGHGKRKQRRQKGRQNERGLFGVLHLLLSDFVIVLVPSCDC